VPVIASSLSLELFGSKVVEAQFVRKLQPVNCDSHVCFEQTPHFIGRRTQTLHPNPKLNYVSTLLEGSTTPLFPAFLVGDTGSSYKKGMTDMNQDWFEIHRFWSKLMLQENDLVLRPNKISCRSRSDEYMQLPFRAHC